MRIPVNYRHLESDARPFEIIEDGFRHLDRAIAAGGEHGIDTLIDLHALPGSQNQHWHSDNPTHRALFWEHRLPGPCGRHLGGDRRPLQGQPLGRGYTS